MLVPLIRELSRSSMPFSIWKPAKGPGKQTWERKVDISISLPNFTKAAKNYFGALLTCNEIFSRKSETHEAFSRGQQ